MAQLPDSSPRPLGDGRAIDVAGVRLFHLHERIGEEQTALEDMETRLDVALRENDVAAIEALEDEARLVKFRVDELISPLIFATGEYRLLEAAILEWPA